MSKSSVSSGGPSRVAVTLGWSAVVLCVLLVGLGFATYGLSLEVLQRVWTDLSARAHGPMTFRFYLQPTMAAIAALHDGISDARRGHKSFFWVAWFDPRARTGRLREGLISVARIILLGLTMDMIYQYQVLEQLYPAEAVLITLLLAVVPYFAFRPIVEAIAHRRIERRAQR